MGGGAGKHKQKGGRRENTWVRFGSGVGDEIRSRLLSSCVSMIDAVALDTGNDGVVGMLNVLGSSYWYRCIFVTTWVGHMS